MNYNLADLVKFQTEKGEAIGRIEDFNKDENWFEYFEYITPADLPQGQLYP